ncbi:hypothetical protein LguiA_004689 [Lonicera macranthoides]
MPLSQLLPGLIFLPQEGLIIPPSPPSIPLSPPSHSHSPPPPPPPPQVNHHGHDEIKLSLSVSLTFCLSTDDKYALLAIKTNIIDRSGILSNNWSTTSNSSICSWIAVSCDLNNKRVTTLNLSSMDLTGAVDPVIENHSFLTSLDISYNNLSGTIPASLSNITKLETLNLRFNLLTGSVPDEIFNISSLRVIDLAANDFYGSLPLDICSSYVHKLEGIYLFLNRFEGEITWSVSKCRKLQYQSLAQ